MNHVNEVVCDICHATVLEKNAYEGWGGWTCHLEDNPECRPPMCRPRVRLVAQLSTELLDELEWDADVAQSQPWEAELDHTTLRALIDAARRYLDET